MPSFDIVSEVDKTEVKNAVEQTNKEVGTRFDFKGSDARVEQAELVLTVHADNEFQLNQVQDILNAKLTKRGVDIKCLEISEKIEKVSGNKIKRSCTVKVGVEIDLAKKIVKFVKDSKMKVQASIQGDTVRITGGKRDDLQAAIQLIRTSITDFPLQYQNFRD
ncbi:putative nucleotide binding protein YajQ [Candidatus Nitrotoga sp. BS]|uniref:YajQ family cyclic di-GMP-binding protein n=1 Tax=Candidatus Nitrotoga sp. BS TaxID=2890408 RepID=UPI001EF3A138|nr:YajQ family cyclic di-GMP-binding protein [Candidatus Nitrotoga sp. BS]CAH1199381.1 putative nucleotide binding protein YajQ [Candidatus Nitrotoga sp. BS]